MGVKALRRGAIEGERRRSAQGFRYSGPMLWGANFDSVPATQVTNMINAGINVVRIYKRLDAGTTGLTATMTGYHNSGMLLLIDMVMTGTVTYADVVNGATNSSGVTYVSIFDDLLNDLIDLDYVSSGKPTRAIFMLNHECDGSNKSAGTVGDHAGYISCHQFLYNRLRAKTRQSSQGTGDERVLFGWCVTEYGAHVNLSGGAITTAGTNSRINSYYPGDSYVDILAPDTYAGTGSNGTDPKTWRWWLSADTPPGGNSGPDGAPLTKWFTQWRDNTSQGLGKQIIVPEHSVRDDASDTTQKPAYITGMGNYFEISSATGLNPFTSKYNLPEFIGTTWWNGGTVQPDFNNYFTTADWNAWTATRAQFLSRTNPS